MAGLEPALDGGARRFVVTGVGSSAAHARFLVHLLREALGCDAHAVPLSAFVDATVPSSEDVLIVISQGLSPNARLALDRRSAWKRVVVATAATEEGARRAGDAAKADLLAELRAAGVAIFRFPAGEDEFETLVRVVGPIAGYLAALRLAGAIAAAIAPGRPERRHAAIDAAPSERRAATGPAASASRRAASPSLVSSLAYDLDAICAAIASAPATLDRALAGFDVGRLRDGVALLTSGTYGELIENLRYKVLEGMLLPLPAAWDLLGVAHGALQQAHTGAMTFIALTRADARAEPALLSRVERALDRERHALLRFPATLPGALAIFEHEALMNELMLRFIAARQVDQIAWPGRALDRELYALARPRDVAGAPAPDPPGEAGRDAAGDAGRDAAADAGRDAGAAPAPRSRGSASGRPPVIDARSEQCLEWLTWPELEALLGAGARTAVVPLGSTEQHGPHLPYATDAVIAEELARRFCTRVPEAIRCPVVTLGCSAEHAAFPGTLDVRAETLIAVLRDVLRSLRLHGFAAAFVFSAHGGNCAPLRAGLDELRAAAAPMRVVGYTDLAEVTALAHRSSAAFGVSADASGHHAGEFETSIMRALRPETVRAAAIDAGRMAGGGDAQALFYPSLRANAPTGVVGDPRAAGAERADGYLQAWVDVLVTRYRSEVPST